MERKLRMGMTKTNGWRWTALALLALAALLALHLAAGLRAAGTAPGTAAAGTGMAAPGLFRWPALDSGVWKLFRSGAPAVPQAAAGALSARYRLAGVFLILSDSGDRSDAENRCAILDDLQTKQQYLASEQEWLDRVRVVTVENDHVVLSDGTHEETVYLAAGTLPGRDKAGPAAAPAGEAPKILETNRFGNRIGETRWEFNRQAILDYYQEMMDNPERLAALFMAMEADRDEAGKVAGYRLNLEVGEKDFYTQVGLQQGDVVRKVNSMHMTSQRRAEYFIGEFVQNRLGAVVFDIERNGEAKKLIYLIK
jgi:type II secretory pathway component PulC